MPLQLPGAPRKDQRCQTDHPAVGRPGTESKTYQSDQSGEMSVYTIETVMPPVFFELSPWPLPSSSSIS